MVGLPVSRFIRREEEVATPPVATVTLDYDARMLRRRRLQTDEGFSIFVDLRETTSLEGGDCFLLDDGSLVMVRAAPEAVLVGRETILRNGEPVGYLTSGGYGYTIGKSVGYGYVRNADGVSDEFLASGDYELVVANERVPANLGMEAFFDPSNARVKA